MRSLEAVREKAEVSKAELARRTCTRPEAMRRLLTDKEANPTLATVMSVARSLGYKLALVPASPQKHSKVTRTDLAKRSSSARAPVVSS